MSHEATEQEASVAYHEAGHAVACFLLRRAFRYVSIEPDGDALDHVKYRQLPRDFDPDRLSEAKWRYWVERAVMIKFAGEIAEFEAGFEPESGWEDDFDRAVDMIFSQSGSQEEAQAYCDWLNIRTQNMIKHAGKWNAVEAVASALLEQKRIGYREARKIIYTALQPLGMEAMS